MKKDPDKQVLLYLKVPEALAQWYANKLHEWDEGDKEVSTPFRYECNVDWYKLEALNIRKDETISRYLRVALTKQPAKGDDFDYRSANLSIMIPNFYGQPASVFNYLGTRERGTLKQMLLDRMITDMLKYIKSASGGDYRRGKVNVKNIVEEWMHRNNIDITDTSYNYFVKHYQRSRSADRLRRWRANL